MQILAIFIAPTAGAPMQEVSQVCVRAGHGIIGDRYEAGIGAFSKKRPEVRDLSLISEEKNKVKLFISIATGPDSYIQTGHEKYREATAWLEEFLQSLSLEENVRSEETKLNELKNSKIKFQRLAVRHIRE